MNLLGSDTKSNSSWTTANQDHRAPVPALRRPPQQSAQVVPGDHNEPDEKVDHDEKESVSDFEAVMRIPDNLTFLSSTNVTTWAPVALAQNPHGSQTPANEILSRPFRRCDARPKLTPR